MILGLFTNPSHDFGVVLRKGEGGGGGVEREGEGDFAPKFRSPYLWKVCHAG